MKTKIKRHSRSVLSIVLTLCMLVSCMTVGIIATDAAGVTNNGAVGASVDVDKVGSQNWGSTFSQNSDFKIHGNFRQDGSYNSNWEFTWMYWSNNNEVSVTYLCKANTNYFFRINIDGTEYSPTSDNDTKIDTVYDSPDQDANGAFYITTNNASSGFVKVVIRLWANYSGNNRIEVTQTDCSSAPNAFGQPNGESSWSTSNTKNLTYDDATGRYYFDADNVGQVTFRFWLFDTHHFSPQRASGDNVSISDDASNRTPCWEVSSSDQNVAFTVDSTDKKIRIWISAHGVDTTWTNAGGVTVWYEVLEDYSSDTDYYLAGMYSDGTAGFFGTAWAPKLDDNKMTYSGGKYSITYSKSAGATVPEGSILFKVVKNGEWSDGSYPSANQSAVVYADSTYVKFTFDPSTEKITFEQDGTGNTGSSGDWVAGDKYTSSGTSSSQKVANTPDIGSTTATYYYVWNDNDNGPGTDGSKTPIATVSNSNNGYWADITTQAKANSNFYFALSINTSNSGIRGNKFEQINCVTKAAGESVTIYTSNHEQAFVVEMKERSNVSGSAHFILVRGADWTKISNIGVMAYYSGGAVDYQFYFKEIGSGDDEEVTVNYVNIYAKNGNLRDSTFNRFTDLANTDIVGFYYKNPNDNTEYTSVADYNVAFPSNQISLTNDVSGYNSSYAKMTNVPVGSKITLRTYLLDSEYANSVAFKDSHYLKAYAMNGKTYKVHTASEAQAGSGTYADAVYYEEEWTVEAVNTANMKNEGTVANPRKVVEINPIYYLQDNTNTKMFYIDGYVGDLQTKWGTMLAVYPYYEGKSNKANAFGGYPGQPMLYWGGKYQMEIPLTVDGTSTGAQVKGLTLHNAYWDLMHRSLDEKCDDAHCQTYDYDDFYKLYKEKDPDSIIFDFKYETTRDNYGDGYDYTNYTFAGSAAATAETYNGSEYNGVEYVTNYFGKQVDAFGTLIPHELQTDFETNGQTTELLFVSTGYKDTYVGEYATIWAVYAPSTVPSGCNDTANQFIGYISSSMLYLNNLGRVSQYTGGTSTASGRMSWEDFTNTYTHLKTYYQNVPALISYEKELWNDSKDKANRSDGKWYYSNSTDTVVSNIKIQYGPASLLEASDKSLNSDQWINDEFSSTKTGLNGEKNVGDHTDCTAYFTNTSPEYLVGKTTSGEIFADNSQQFTFKAQTAGNYQFVGWVRYSNGKYYEITDELEGESNISANDTYIARFVQSKSGSLLVSHNVQSTATYTGTGTPHLTVVVKNGSTEVYNSGDITNGSDVDISQFIKAKNASYTIDITMSTVPDTDCTVAKMTSSSGNYEAETSESLPMSTSDTVNFTVAQFTVANVMSSGVTSLRYVSNLAKTIYDYRYEIKYTYLSRFWGQQSYTVKGAFLNENIALANMDGSKAGATLKTSFIVNQTPYEKNFRETINWNYTDSKVGNANAMTKTGAVLDSGSTIRFVLKADVYADKTVDDRVTAEFLLPYDYNGVDQGYTYKGVDVYDSNGTKIEGEEEIYYKEAEESVKVISQAGKLFAYDGSAPGGGDNVKPSDIALVEAAPYVVMNPTTHTHKEHSDRYMTGTYFTIGSTYYYYDVEPTDVPSGVTVKQLTASDTCTVGSETYTYAVKDNATGIVYSYQKGGANEQYTMTTEYDVVDGIVKGTGTKKYFAYWEVRDSSGNFITRSYRNRFNYSGYSNYTITPVYNLDAPSTDMDTTDTDLTATISYLGDSRNQWNEYGSGNYKQVTNASADLMSADKLFADFAIAYTYNGEEIAKIKNASAGGENIYIGLLIEQVGVIEHTDTAVTTKNAITNPAYYANKYKDTYQPDEIKNVIRTTSCSNSDFKTATGIVSANSKIGSNVSTWGTLFTAENYQSAQGYTKVLDNFNRLHYTKTFNSMINGTDKTDDDYAYRAIAYICVGNTQVALSDPVYFTLYDTAKR